MARPFLLPSFAESEDGHRLEDAEAQARLKASRDEGYEEGYQAGASAAALAHAEDQARLSASLAEALRDQSQQRQEAQQQVLQGVLPLITGLIAHLTPRLADQGLADHVGVAVAAALAARPGPAPVVHCAPEALAPLRQALADWEGLKLQADPSMTPHEAEVHWDDGFDAINVTGLLRHIDDALARLTDPGIDTADPPDEEELAAHAG